MNQHLIQRGEVLGYFGRCYGEINPWFVGKYCACFDNAFGRFVRSDWYVVDDFGDVVSVDGSF